MNRVDLTLSSGLRQINQPTQDMFTTLKYSGKKELSSAIHGGMHDIRSPLTVIKPYIEFLKKVDEKEKRDVILDRMSLSVTKMEKIINGLVEYTDILLLDNVPTEHITFKDILNHVEMELSESIMESDAVILSDFSVSPSIKYVSAQFKKVLFHLLDNAIKYRHPERSPIIRIYTQLTEDSTIFTILDNGTGMEIDSTIGKPFTKLKKEHDNVGLGFAIINAIVEKNGGKVEIKSDPDGTTIRLTLNRF